MTDSFGDSFDQPKVVDVTAVLRGGAAALVIVVPAAIGQRIASEGSSLKGLLFLIVLIGFGWGGAVAAKAAPPGRALTNGGLAGLAAVLAYLVIAVVVRLATDSPVDAVPLAFTAFLGVSCGILGAELGERRRRRAPAVTDDPGDDGPESPI